MDLVINLVGLAVPVLTNWITVTYTHDYVVITLVDLLVMWLVNFILVKLRNSILHKGYIELDVEYTFPLFWVLIVLGAAAVFFTFMHTSIINSNYTCGNFIFELPAFANLLYSILYLIAIAALVLYFLPKVESVFYFTFHGGSNSLLWVIISGAFAGAKGYWMIQETYNCSLNVIWIFVIWVAVCIFLQWVISRDFSDGLATRQAAYLALTIGAVLIYSGVSFVKSTPQLAHPNNFWTTIVAKK